MAAELTLGALGVVPLGLLVIKAHRSAKEKLKTYKNYDNEAARLQKEFDIQRQFFKNEWMILLKLVIQDAGVRSSMNSDFSHEHWSDPKLDQHLREALEHNYKTCLTIFEDIHMASRELESEFERVSWPLEDQEEVWQRRRQTPGNDFVDLLS